MQAYFDGQEYYSVVKAVNAANDSENGGDVTLATNAVLGMHDDISLDENVRLLTGDYSIIIKSDVKVYSMQQLIGMLIVKEDGGISLHARRIEFEHPVSKAQIDITAPVPDDNLWKALEKAAQTDK